MSTTRSSPGPATTHRDEHARLHRLHGPAVEGVDGYRAWYVHGQLHRLDGPAVESPDGRHWWHVAGRAVTRAQAVNDWLREHCPACPYPVRAEVYDATECWQPGDSLPVVHERAHGHDQTS